jgi:glycerol uptake facilitator-like aquaporin
VTVAVYCVGSISGGHLNPAVTVAMASIGKLGWDLVPVYIGAKANLKPEFGWDTGFGPALVGVLVWAIGLSLGGPTGYSLNPARDLSPRIAHALLPIAGKGGSDWGYAWVPVVGPLIGGVLGATIYKMLWPA